VVEKDTQKKLMTAGKGGVPMRTSSFALPELANSPFYTAMKTNMEVVLAKPKAPKIFEIYDALGPIVQQVGQGRLTPEQGAKMGQEKMLAICKKCLL
jgi:multiple sugar transport system substrate-binding protein